MAASEAGPCTSTPSPARRSGRASTARRGSSAHPTADSRGSSAVSDPAGPSQSRADPIGVDSSMPSTVEIPAGASQPPSPAAPPAAYAASSFTPSTTEPEDPVHPRQPRPRLARLPHGELLPQRQILQRQLAARANRGAECPKKDPKPSDHDRPNSRSLRTTQDPCDRRVFRRDNPWSYPDQSRVFRMHMGCAGIWEALRRQCGVHPHSRPECSA
jgi:hypothetical protein